MMKVLLVAAACMAAPATAQVGSPPPTASPAAVDPARLAMAKTTIDHVWPLGSYARMMGGGMDSMMDGMMMSMMDMKPGDIVPGEAGRSADAGLDGKTMREVMATRDPHWQERMRLTARAMTDGMAALFTRIEPRIRDGLAIAYARRFDVRQLADMNAFFATSSGTAYVRESLTLMQDPEFMKVMVEFAPAMMREMPAIVKKAEAATAHLPPLPKTAERSASD